MERRSTPQAGLSVFIVASELTVAPLYFSKKSGEATQSLKNLLSEEKKYYENHCQS